MSCTGNEGRRVRNVKLTDTVRLPGIRCDPTSLARFPDNSAGGYRGTRLPTGVGCLRPPVRSRGPHRKDHSGIRLGTPRPPDHDNGNRTCSSTGSRPSSSCSCLPPTGPLLLALVGLVVAIRRPRLGWWIAFSGIALLLLLAMPAVAGFIVRCIDTTPAFDASRPTNAQAIVILGGGTRRYAPEYGGATLSTLGLERVRYGARLARLTGLPVLVSGGSVDKDDPVEALIMRDMLTHEYGVPVRWVEAKSRNTHENAVDSAVLLKASGVTLVILVVHGFDVPRARAEFEAAGISVIAAPTGHPARGADRVRRFSSQCVGIAGKLLGTLRDPRRRALSGDVSRARHGRGRSRSAIGKPDLGHG